MKRYPTGTKAFVAMDRQSPRSVTIQKIGPESDPLANHVRAHGGRYDVNCTACKEVLQRMQERGMKTAVYTEEV